MSFRTRLTALERIKNTPAAALKGTAYCEAKKRYEAEVSEWTKAWLVGTEGPFPVDLTFMHADPKVAENYHDRRISSARLNACITARMNGQIGQTDYLPRMSNRERFECDQMCGLLYVIDPELKMASGEPDTPCPWPEWAKFREIAFEQWKDSQGSAHEVIEGKTP